MITNNNSWSLRFSRRSFARAEATPNKSLDQFAAFIRGHSPSDLSTNFRISDFGPRISLRHWHSVSPTSRPLISPFVLHSVASALSKFVPDSCQFVSQTPHISEAKRNFLTTQNR